MTTCTIIPGGDDPGSEVMDRARMGGFIIAADSGLDQARRHGIEPNLVIGDMDSVEQDSLAAFGGEIEKHSPDKNKTDLSLALDRALEMGASTIEVLGGGGGRFDHLMANCVVLASPRLEEISIRWFQNASVTTVVHNSVELDPSHGVIVTLLAMGGDASGVSISGVRWPLESVTLPFGSSWGVSNQLTGATASVSVASGTVIAIQVTNS